MKSSIIAIVGLVAVTLAGGCFVQFKMNNKSETDMGSHHVVVKPGNSFTSNSSSTGSDTETYKFSCGEISVTIQNEELIVNNVKYGTLKPGEAVLIDNGTVFVADQQRQATP